MLKQSDSVAAVRAPAAAVKPKIKLHDKQSERDYRELRIDKVGVRGLRFPVQIRDKAHSRQNKVTTLCPCSKAISDYGAHNQRGEVTVQVRFSKSIWIEDLIAIVEGSASAELFALLKREDEKAVTERAYANPVFVEDLVRNVAVKLNAHPDVTWYKVEAENYESIHNHNAYACIEKG